MASSSNSPPSPASQPNEWEAAYLRFETPEQEIAKFIKRLRYLGIPAHPSAAQIVELFCGRGNGLHALSRLGFTELEGVDLSPALLEQYRGPARCHVADCRNLPFPDESKDIAIVQGGLHHLPTIPADLELTLAEMARVLRKGGLAVLVEPWSTPFLTFVHAVSSLGVMKRLSTKLEAFDTMTRHELVTYRQWLGQPERILQAIEGAFQTRTRKIRWGKLLYVGIRR